MDDGMDLFQDTSARISIVWAIPYVSDNTAKFRE